MKRKCRKKRSKSKAGFVSHQKDRISASLLRAETILLDSKDDQLIIISKDILINQLHRDGPKIQKSFDALCSSDIEEISAFISCSVSILYSGLLVSKKAKAHRMLACTELLINALNSLGASTQLLRSGYTLQPGIVIRSILESVSTVFHLLDRPNDFEKYQNGLLESPKTIAAAKKAIPTFGSLYRAFSENFTHIGHLHRTIQRVEEYRELNDPLKMNIGFLKMTSWLIYVCSELLFHNLIQEPRYWQKVEGGFMYNPSEEERGWMEKYLGL